MNKKWIIIISIAIVLLITSVTGYILYRSYQAKNSNSSSSSNRASDVNDETKVSKVSPSSTNSTTDSTYDSNNTIKAGWTELKNTGISYLIHYPDGASVSGISGESNDPTQAKCVKISADYYYVIVATVDSASTCIGSYSGEEWHTSPPESVSAAGVEYSATGVFTEAASAGYYYDHLLISPVDGQVKIGYGISVNEKYGTVSKVDAKAIVHQIIASYSPAE